MSETEKKPLDPPAGDDAGDSSPDPILGEASVSSSFRLSAGLLRSRCAVALTRRLLVVLALCVVVLSVYEAYSNQPVSMPPILQAPFDAVMQGAYMANSTSLSDTKDMFARRRIFGPPPPMNEDPDSERNPVRGWRAEVRGNWELKGTSAVQQGSEKKGDLEAIVFDNRIKKMHFLQVGQDIRISEQMVSVTRVEADRIELRSGDEIFVLE